jgi:hypothetical protein
MNQNVMHFLLNVACRKLLKWYLAYVKKYVHKMQSCTCPYLTISAKIVDVRFGYMLQSKCTVSSLSLNI